MEKLVFIGAGAANMFAILYLLKNNPNYDITVLEKGKNIFEREKKEILHGNFGSGLYSDNKLIFSEHSDQPLIQFIGKEQALSAYDFIQEMITEFHPVPDDINITHPTETSNTGFKSGWGDLSMKQSLCWHVGSKYAQDIGENIETYMRDKGVKFVNEVDVYDVRNGKVFTNQGEFLYDKVFIGVGKVGRVLTSKILKDKGITAKKKEVQIGVRFETEFSEGVQEIVAEQYDFKYSRDVGNHNIRTFCVCNNAAYVCKEEFKGHNGLRIQWNGEGYGMNNLEKRNHLTNFGIMVDYKVENGDKFLEKLEERFQGQGFVFEGPNCQYNSRVDLPDIVTKEKFYELMGEELSDIIFNFVEDIEKILKINGNYRMFLPEIKEVPGKITRPTFELDDGIFMVGDGSPICPTRGIVPAASSGILCVKSLFKGE